MENCKLEIFNSESDNGLMVRYPDCSVTRLLTKSYCDRHPNECYNFVKTEIPTGLSFVERLFGWNGLYGLGPKMGFLRFL